MLETTVLGHVSGLALIFALRVLSVELSIIHYTISLCWTAQYVSNLFVVLLLLLTRTKNPILLPFRGTHMAHMGPTCQYHCSACSNNSSRPMVPDHTV